MIRGVALLLTVLTGFSGLVYQVAWQKYLAMLLGSHSEATAAVLGIFLGGLAVGYAVFGRLTRWIVLRADRRARRPGLLLLYGCVEAAIGAYALLFPRLFEAVNALAVRTPHGSEGMAFAVDVCVTAALIGPPTALMGGTIPLLTQGLARNLADATRFHSLVYAFNTTGAFAGALAAGFFLIPSLGLEGSVLGMGCVNLIAGAAFVLLHMRDGAATQWDTATGHTTTLPEAGDGTRPRGFPAFCAVVVLAGFAMMTLQTVLNRIGAFALGASHFTFAMVVATFVLCIAIGSFAVSALARIRPVYLVASQWLLVLYLLGLHRVIDDVPYWTHVLRSSLANGADFALFHVAFFAAALALLALPLGLSGALLPLLFHHLRRHAVDLGGVAGRLYSWNTIGSLAGALLGGYLLLFWMDLDGTYRLAVTALAAAACLSTAVVAPQARIVAGLALGLVIAALASQPDWDAKKLFAGLFRHHHGERDLAASPDDYMARLYDGWADDFVLFHDDDPSTSIAVFEIGGKGEPSRQSIINNGKSDGNVPGDNVTTGLLALLPALFAEKCERAFVIGYGTGVTAGELAALRTTQGVVVAEISPGVIDAAPLFEEFNRGALANPKTRIIRSDAYRALLRTDERYDVIVSEPSNPWVTGVEMLYAREFLEAARAHLAPGGVYAQWFHTYETDDASVALVLNTYRSVFERVSVWYGRQNDLILLGFEDGERQVDLAELERRWHRDDFHRQLTALPIHSFPRLLAHEVLPLGVLRHVDLPEPVHTLAHPVLSFATARAFFAGRTGRLPESLGREATSTAARNSLVLRYRASHGGVLPVEDRLEILRETCDLDLRLCATLFAQWMYEEPESETLRESLRKARESEQYGAALRPEILSGIIPLFRPEASGDMPPTFEVARDLAAVFTRYYHHAAPFHPASLHGPWIRCARRDPRCAAGIDAVLAKGFSPPRLSQR